MKRQPRSSPRSGKALRTVSIIGTGSYIPAYASPDSVTGQSANVTPFWMIGGAGAEVEVDSETGRVRGGVTCLPAGGGGHPARRLRGAWLAFHRAALPRGRWRSYMSRPASSARLSAPELRGGRGDLEGLRGPSPSPRVRFPARSLESSWARWRSRAPGEVRSAATRSRRGALPRSMVRRFRSLRLK